MTSRILAILFWCLSVGLPAMGGNTDPEYLANKIPATLTTGADAVVRKHELVIKIKSLSKVYTTEKVAITILNEKGEKYAQLQEWYNKQNNIVAVHGWLYDKEGNQIKKAHKKDISDRGSTGYNFLDDSRYKTFSFNYASYPYTVVYELERVATQTFFISRWQPIPGYNCALQQGIMTITYPDSLSIRYSVHHLTDSVTKTQQDGSTTITISANELPARNKPADYATSEIFSLPTVVAVADSFELEGRRGSQSSWANYGQFAYDLNKNRDTLPIYLKKTIHDLTDTCTTSLSKIALLYAYLQKNTRYVSIQLGIGGWQAMKADAVATNGYGDCKALSNFMQAMLKETGITTYQVLIIAGSEGENMLLQQIPFNIFNHMILCVPLPNDTIWFDCTSKIAPISQLSNFTSGREALLLQHHASTVVSTPRGDVTKNSVVRKSEYSIYGTGEVTCEVYEKYQGLMWEREASILLKKTKSEVDNYLNRKFALPTYTVKGYEVSNNEFGNPTITETTKLSADGMVKSSGKRLFVTTAIFRCPVNIPTDNTERTVPFQLSNSYALHDTLVIKIPTDYITDKLPAATEVSYPFGGYTHQLYQPNDSTIIVATSYHQLQGSYPATLFSKFAAMCKKTCMSHSDIVLKKRE